MPALGSNGVYLHVFGDRPEFLKAVEYLLDAAYSGVPMTPAP